MQLNGPLSPALSPSEGERERFRSPVKRSRFGEPAEPRGVFSLSPSEGERAGERGPFNCIVRALGTPNPIREIRLSPPMVRFRRTAPLLLALLALTSGACLNARSQTGTSTNKVIVRHQRVFAVAAKEFKSEPENPETAWRFGRACFDVADVADSSKEKAVAAEQGIAACRQALVRDSNSAPAHYYLGMNLGELAQTRGIGALKLIKEMEAEFKLARDLDEHFDYAGPDRNLGLLYFQAPSIASIGSRSKARKHLQRAVELAPESPENRLNLIEAYLKWGDRHDATRELIALEELLPAARANFAGEAWTASWTDWEQRLKKVSSKIERPPNTLQSPHK